MSMSPVDGFLFVLDVLGFFKRILWYEKNEGSNFQDLEVWGVMTEKKWWMMKKNGELVGGFKYFLFSPLLGEMIQFD